MQALVLTAIGRRRGSRMWCEQDEFVDTIRNRSLEGTYLYLWPAAPLAEGTPGPSDSQPSPGRGHSGSYGERRRDP